MYTTIACIILCFMAVVTAGVIETHHVVQEPVLAKVATAPSAVSHQSFTRFHNNAVVSPVIAPVVKSTIHETPVVSVVKASPVVHTYAASPLVHSVPVLHAAPSAYTIYH